MAEPTIDKMTQKLAAARTELYRANKYWNWQVDAGTLAATLSGQLLKLVTTVGWCALLVRIFEERMEIQKVEVIGNAELTKEFARWSRVNDLRTLASLAHNELLGLGRVYIAVGAREEPGMESVPLFTAESPFNMWADTDPRTGKVRAAVREYKSSETLAQPDGAVLYLPNRTVYYGRGDAQVGWSVTHEVVHNLGEVPVVPLVNRATLTDREGTPEHKIIWDLQDAAARTLTSLQIAQEFMAVPQRVILNADPEDFSEEAGEDENGEVIEQAVSEAETYLRRMLVLTGDAKIGEFSAASLQNYTQTLMSLARKAASLAGVPLDFFGVASESNPSSGDSIRANADRMIKRAERLDRGVAPGWEEVYRLGYRVTHDGETIPELADIQAVFEDPATATRQALADGALKLSQIKTTEGPLFTRDYLWDYLGVSEDAQEEMRDALQSQSLDRLLNAIETPNPIPEPQNGQPSSL